MVAGGRRNPACGEASGFQTSGQVIPVSLLLVTCPHTWSHSPSLMFLSSQLHTWLLLSVISLPHVNISHLHSLIAYALNCVFSGFPFHLPRSYFYWFLIYLQTFVSGFIQPVYLISSGYILVSVNCLWVLPAGYMTPDIKTDFLMCCCFIPTLLSP